MIFAWGLGYQIIGQLPHRDRLRCHTCGWWTRDYALQGDEWSADPDATARLICDRCAVEHRG